MASPRHAWERPSSSSAAHPWEVAGYGAQELSDSDDDIDPQESASLEFLNVLIDLYNGGLSAKNVCTLCYWASQAGMKGDLVAQYAFKPTSSGGNFQRHLERVMGMDYEKKQAGGIEGARVPLRGIGSWRCASPREAAA